MNKKKAPHEADARKIKQYKGMEKIVKNTELKSIAELVIDYQENNPDKEVSMRLRVDWLGVRRLEVEIKDGNTFRTLSMGKFIVSDGTIDATEAFRDVVSEMIDREQEESHE